MLAKTELAVSGVGTRIVNGARMDIQGNLLLIPKRLRQINVGATVSVGLLRWCSLSLLVRWGR